MVDRLSLEVNSYSSFSLLRLVFWKSIHLEVYSCLFFFLTGLHFLHLLFGLLLLCLLFWSCSFSFRPMAINSLSLWL